ncbi:hypothetical protein M231_07006 [Tremella mesenterica]|uniref:Zn(2)-C6 fungal-type domain-containing protein n=1 Tax=Tremella mesenterica TaxID=5217 RepID=A0A4Q1BCE9_TREME|nr:uncharacterized protein TREMEDRAFT_71262 [Tremella mesenterica DSM 1558]EIW71813.1 hypothetical protein TREMEDRAFT_71262 [Tremella mesenterica DSM 1558]RXK35717.1 hypothetical protein M231_07006 [Tremella mesenterica]
MDTMDPQQQADSEALASAVGAAAAAAHQLGLRTHHHSQSFHHTLQQPNFSDHKENGGDQVDINQLDIPTVGDDGDDGLGDLGLTMGDDLSPRGGYGRPPSIRKACDLCHAAKQKCSGDRPTCTRCQAGGWQCVYAPRQRRRTAPKDQKSDSPRLHANMALPPPQPKKRKLGVRDSWSYADVDKMAMNIALDMGLGTEEDGEEMIGMTEEQMLESIAIDGYLADLPLATYVRNLPYIAPPPPPEPHFSADDFPSTGDMDQHTTSALRDAIFSLNESGAGITVHPEPSVDHHDNGEDQDQSSHDPHLALLDLSHINDDTVPSSDTLNLPSLYSGCNHQQLVPHVLSLLSQHALEPKPGANTPLTLSIFSPLSRALRLLHSLTQCSHCNIPHQTLPQLALLSRTTTVLTFPFPPISSSPSGSAQITLHGARLSGTGLSEAIEQHIVGVVWDSWRAAVREVFNAFERKAQEIMRLAAQQQAKEGGDRESNGGSAETQRAGLMFQATSRLITAMDEVEGS